MSNRFVCRLLTGGALVPLMLAAQVSAHAGGQGAFWQHWQRAMALYQGQEFAQAIEEMQAAYDIEPLPRLLFNLGRAHLKMRHAEEALRFFDRYEQLSKVLTPQERSQLESARSQARDLTASTSMESPPVVPAPEPPAVLPPAPVAPASSPVQTVQREAPKKVKWTPARRAAIGILGGAFAGVLATGITLNALDGHSVGSCESGGLSYGTCRYNFTAGYGVAYASAGLLAGAAILTLVWP